MEDNALKNIKRVRDELDILYNAKKQKRSSTPSTSFATEKDLKEAGLEDLSDILSDDSDDDTPSTEALDVDAKEHDKN